MVSVCLPSDVLSQHLPSYLGLSYLGHVVCLHGCSSKVQLLLLTLGEGYLLTAALPDLEGGLVPLGPPALAQPQLLGCGVAPLGRSRSLALSVAAPDLGRGIVALGHASARSAWPKAAIPRPR